MGARGTRLSQHPIGRRAQEDTALQALSTCTPSLEAGQLLTAGAHFAQLHAVQVGVRLAQPAALLCWLAVHHPS